ncbi:MAG TPA: hypothetical protein VF941_24380 [Clostridia bacterium]
MQIKKECLSSLPERIFMLEPAFSARKDIAFLEQREEELFERLKKEIPGSAANILMEYSDVLTLLCIEAESHFYERGMNDAGGFKVFLKAFISKILK